MHASVKNEKIILNFGWKGWCGGDAHVGVVDLVFKNAKTEISVRIPKNISPSTVTKLPFRCRRYEAPKKKMDKYKLFRETSPELLQVSIEQIRNLRIRVGIFEASPQSPSIAGFSRSDREVKLDTCEEMEMGQTYSLVVTSDKHSLSACLLKEESDLDRLTNEELQARLEEVFKKEREFKKDCLEGTRVGNLKDFHKLTAAQEDASRELTELRAIWAKRGMKDWTPPQSESLRLIMNRIKEIEDEAEEAIKQECVPQ